MKDSQITIAESDARLVLEKLSELVDEGPLGEGWKSEDLKRLINRLCIAIGDAIEYPEVQ